MKLKIRTELEMNIPAEKVWSALTHFANWKEWNTSVTSVVGKCQVGETLNLVINMAGKATNGKAKLLVVNPNKELRWRGGLPIPFLFIGEHYFIIEQLSEFKIRFIHGEDFSGLLISFLFKNPKAVEEKYLAVSESLKNFILKNI